MRASTFCRPALGLLYALAGAVAACAAVITFAIAVLIRRIDSAQELCAAVRSDPRSFARLWGDALAETAPAERLSAAPLAIERNAADGADEEPGRGREPDQHQSRGPSAFARVDRNGSGDAGRAAGPPSLIGSYSSAGANYKIFSDGSIEAETNEGTFQFASMSDFKRHLVETKAKAAPASE